jgi:hypothetical protein
LLAALAGQSWQQRLQKPLPVVIVLNNCHDGSHAVVAEIRKWEPRLDITLIDLDLAPDQAHVGTARRIAMETALGLLESPAGGAILTTDADAIPTADWVDANLRHLGEVDLVGGLIRGDASEEAQLGPGFLRRARWHLAYAALTDRLAAAVDPIEHDPWPRHRDHTGASLAERAEVYASVGGMPALARREDLAFVSRVAAAGHTIRHPLDVEVAVSARLVGRAPGGMADCLQEWMREEACGKPLLVEDPQRVLQRLLRRRRLRELGHASIAERVAMAVEVGLDPAAFARPEEGLPSAARLVELYAGDEPDAPATVPVELASDVLEEILACIEELACAA